VQRQYTGTAGRVENSQVAVYLGYSAPRGHALIDRELYVPRSWTTDPGRCAAAGIPDGTAFATKPALARRMLARTLDAGVPAGWVTGDEVYGSDPGLRCDLERRQLGYVLAVACDHRVNAGTRQRADTLAARLPRCAWQRYSAGAGAKGCRYYYWAWLAIDPGQPGHRWLLIRRNRTTRQLAFYRCYAPRHVPLPALVTVAGTRWTIERTSPPARPWPAWTSTRSAPGRPGTGGSPSPCSPPRSSPSPPPGTPAAPRTTRSR
jgi:SRSO17 transposase